ncbi:transposase, partial [Providencia rettgeri]
MKKLLWQMTSLFSMCGSLTAYDAQKASPSKKAGKPEKALNFISKLYGLEKKAKGLDAKSRHQLRQEEAKPILDEFKQWLDSQNVLPKGLL